MWLPRNVLLWLCGRIAAKGTYAENTFSPEKNNRNEILKGKRAAGSRSWRGILWLWNKYLGCDIYWKYVLLRRFFFLVEFRWKKITNKSSPGSLQNNFLLVKMSAVEEVFTSFTLAKVPGDPGALFNISKTYLTLLHQHDTPWLFLISWEFLKWE